MLAYSVKTFGMDIHEISPGYPRRLVTGSQRISNDRQTGSQSGLVHQSDEVDGGTCQEDLYRSGIVLPSGYTIHTVMMVLLGT